MSDANTEQSVECPICGEAFDPAIAGGWCTNTDCGEWQYTDDAADAGDADSESDEEASEGNLISQGTERSADEELAADDGGDSEADSEADDADETSSEESVAEEPDGTESATDDTEAAATDAEAVDPVDLDTEDGGDTDPVGADAEAADPSADVESDTEASSPPEETGVESPDEGDSAGEDSADADAADTLECPDCGTELDGDANFCANCGADVQDVAPVEPLTECPSCGTGVDETDSFCVNCGEDLEVHRSGDTEDDETDAVDALRASNDESVPESLVLEVSGREIEVRDGDTVGREVRAALTDAGRPEDEAVRIHREHVRFVRESDSFYLVDLGDNPTRLGGRMLQKGDREPVAPGDEIELSGVATLTVHTS
ncbi:zinc-ribbon domain-containing protein [Haloarcula marina]|uniref:zinc-ribbon domain-containing protein n=1 Tax=Haloarcula marina TaxID=2961574 RepID=UPI0024E0C3AE|nr:zinc ribbon domain-containing protein [Halomicroarcula marina]